MAIETRQRDQQFVISMLGEGKFNPDMLAAFHAALDAAEADAEATALIISGTEKNFSQGLDLDHLGQLPAEQFLDFVQRSMTVIARLLCFPLPTVAAVNGHAFGLGAMISLGCDYRVMREDRGYFCLPEADLGMTLIAPMNALVTSKLQGNLLRDALFAARRFGATELVAAGLFDAACPQADLLATATAVAAPMVGKPRDALSGLKADANAAVIDCIYANASAKR